MSRRIPERITDYHSHILPGVDDGVRTMEESMSILEGLEEIGITDLWLTPHIMEDIPNTTEDLKQRFSVLVEKNPTKIRLNLAAEYMMDALFEERLQKGDLLPLGKDGNHLLVETSYFNPPMDLYGILEKVRVKGYYPVLAHPERYVYMEKKDYKHLKEMGVLLQMNVGSIGKVYGKEVYRKAKWMLRKGMYSLFGSDLHRRFMIDVMKENLSRRKMPFADF